MTLIATQGYGFTVDDIDWSTPNDLQPYWDAYNYKRRQDDELLWMMGMYVGEAIGTMFKGKYPDKPMLEEAYSKNSEYEIEKQRKLFIAKFEAMGANWNIAIQNRNMTNDSDKE